ncbi:MAG: toprim domain-containing protein [Cytophagales bacterium]|nr:toprim domain-containing protein [Cytophagales bacterium]
MLTSEKVLSKVSEEELIEYLVPDFKCNIKQKNYKSIFSDKDNRPSMSIYRKNGNWKFKSHNTGHGGNVFQLWANYYQIDTRTNFKDVLKKINEAFNLELEDNSPLAIEYTSFSALFLADWAQFGIKREILKRYDVGQVDKISFKSKNGKQLNFNYTAYGQIVACYHVNGRIKIYVPQIPQGFNNSNFKGQKKVFGYKNQRKSDVFGLTQLPSKLAYILFTAGEKDCLAANACGFHAISLQSENQFPEVTLLKNLETRTKALVCCYDNDETGRKAAQKLEDKFGLVSITLPEGVKDIADYFLQYTAEDFRPLLETAVEKSLHIDRDKLFNALQEQDIS